MTAADFRRIALGLEGVEEYSHAGLPAFRVGARKFASLTSQAEGYGNLMLTPEQQAAFVEEAPRFSCRSLAVGKDGTHAYSPGGGEQGCTGGCTPNCVETAN
ncbi:MAG TPA: MmcQ/YjbR family DNA-binding protein [Candidatus Angelobacter sp.]